MGEKEDTKVIINNGYLEEHQHYWNRQQKYNKQNWLRNLIDISQV